MQRFWYTIKKVKDSESYEFLLTNKKCIIDAEVFRKILNIYPRVKGEEFTEVQDDDATLTFIIDLGYKGPLHKYTSMYVDHMHKPWRTLAAIINKCLSRKTRSNVRLRKSRIDIMRGMKENKSWCETMPFPRFTKVIMNHFLSQDKSLPKLKFQHYHTIKDDGIESVDVSDMSETEPGKKKTGSRSTRGVVIQDTPSALKPKPAALKLKLKDVQSLTPEEQEAEDTMQAITPRVFSTTPDPYSAATQLGGVTDWYQEPRILQSPTRRYPVHLRAPLSSDYVPGLEEPEQAPPLLEFVPEPVYPEFMPPEDGVLPAEEQPLPAAVSPTTDSLGYIPESDLEEDDDEDPEEDPVDYPTDRDDDDDEEEEEPSGDEADDEEEDEDDDEEQEHQTLADSVPPSLVHRTIARISIPA
ncbi:hypothetical protein Tco_1376270 [Tanacetum coccineum]